MPAAIFVDLYEVAERHWKEGSFSGREGIEAEFVLETGHEHGKSKEVEARFRELKIVLKRG